MADSNEPTVEDENRWNSEADNVHNILDNFMQSREETLEEMVDGFMYLTMEDVRKARNAAPVLFSDLRPSSSIRGETADTVPRTSTSTIAMTASENSAANTDSVGVGREEGLSEDIDEEILEDVTSVRNSCEDALFRHRPASLTKFDNFVLSEDGPGNDGNCSQGENDDNREENDENEEDEDWLPTSGYMASFGAVTGNTASELSPSPDATSSISEAQIVHQKSPEAILPSHQGISLPHDSSTSLKEEETSHSNDASCSESDGVPAVIPESTDLPCDSHSSVCEDDSEAPAWSVNPGEVEEEMAAVPVKQRLSVIEISAKLSLPMDAADPKGNDAFENVENVSSNEVTPFELDEDFDYDNVAYTPKFTQAEMNYLSSFLPHTS